MRVDDVVIGVIVCAFFLVAGIMIFEDQIEGYGINVTNKEFESAERYINETDTAVTQMKEALKPGEIEAASAFDFLIAAASSAITIAWTTLLLPQRMIFEFVAVFKLPTIVGTVLTTIVMISILFGLIYLFFRFKPQRD